jgi:hypothetical protein
MHAEPDASVLAVRLKAKLPPIKMLFRATKLGFAAIDGFNTEPVSTSYNGRIASDVAARSRTQLLHGHPELRLPASSRSRTAAAQSTILRRDPRAWRVWLQRRNGFEYSITFTDSRREIAPAWRSQGRLAGGANTHQICTAIAPWRAIGFSADVRVSRCSWRPQARRRRTAPSLRRPMATSSKARGRRPTEETLTEGELSRPRAPAAAGRHRTAPRPCSRPAAARCRRRSRPSGPLPCV